MKLELQRLGNFDGSSIGYHNAVIHNRHLYVVGGVRAVVDGSGDSRTQRSFPEHKTYVTSHNTIVFHVETGKWSEARTTGPGFPDGIENSAIVVWKNKLLMFGGWTGSEHTNCMWSLDLETFEWCQIEYNSEERVPTPRAGHTMSSIAQDVFFIFGGQGSEMRKPNEFPLATIIQSEKYAKDVYNNQALLFDPVHLKWRLLEQEGLKKPTPRGYHSCTVVKENVFLFGGRNYEAGALDELWIFNTIKHCWSLVQCCTKPYPVYRHSADLVGDSTILVLGGWKKSGGLSNRAGSVYDIATKTWIELDSDGLDTRAGHSACKMENGSILLCGGEVFQNGRRALTNDFLSLKVLYDKS